MTTLNEKVADFCRPIFADPDAIFTAASITTAFIDSQSRRTWPKLPDDLRHAAYIGVQQLVRPLCRHHTRDDEDETQIDLDLPEEKLVQDRYSVPNGRDELGPVFVYKPRHLLTETDMQAVVGRDRKLSAHYARRADALESWWHRTHSATG